ncbi:MAG: T9SS type A sorting domain-containing protein [Flavobacteriales bacterium]|nr:T9SS type A sorting domain-containing protein [Flavobacteriales bacterium]
MAVNGMGQNLVPNPSFEDSVSCPSSSGDIAKAIGWSTLCASPDYFYTCSASNSFGVPNNIFGYQMPASGNAYAGFATYSNSAPNSREFPACNLSTSLSIGVKYYVSFKVALSIEPTFSQTNCASNKIGAMFTTNPYICNTLITNSPPVYTDSIITDSLNWTRIKGSFIADSNYTYLVIGNFFDDANTDTVSFANDFTYNSYYYLDDVCVGTDSVFVYNYSYTTGINKNYFNSQFSFYPNPANNFINVQSNLHVPYNIEIRNTLGQQLYEEQNITSNSLQLNISNYSSGLLFITITSDNNQFTYKLLKH